jgi:hypothetical protein
VVVVLAVFFKGGLVTQWHLSDASNSITTWATDGDVAKMFGNGDSAEMKMMMMMMMMMMTQ